MTNVNCHYGPPGNKGVMPVGIGRKPFKLGAQCTDCKSELGWCENGLCIDCPDKNCDCPITCLNGGVLDKENCKCVCKPGWDGIRVATVALLGIIQMYLKVSMFWNFCSRYMQFRLSCLLDQLNNF